MLWTCSAASVSSWCKAVRSGSFRSTGFRYWSLQSPWSRAATSRCLGPFRILRRKRTSALEEKELTAPKTTFGSMPFCPALRLPHTCRTVSDAPSLPRASPSYECRGVSQATPRRPWLRFPPLRWDESQERSEDYGLSGSLKVCRRSCSLQFALIDADDEPKNRRRVPAGSEATEILARESLAWFPECAWPETCLETLRQRAS